MLPSFAEQLMSQLQRDYDRIGQQFAVTREKPWPEFDLIKPLLQPGQHLLDLGCGNGRLAEIAHESKLHYTGVDFSATLIQLAKLRFPHDTFIVHSLLDLPLPDHRFDGVALIASLQHVPSLAMRQRVLSEAARVAKFGAYLFMLNWNLYQPRWQKFFIRDDTRYDSDDALIPWKNDHGEVLAQRYYHALTTEELSNLCQKVGWQIQQNSLSKTNHNIVTIATLSKQR